MLGCLQTTHKEKCSHKLVTRALAMYVLAQSKWNHLFHFFLQNLCLCLKTWGRTCGYQKEKCWISGTVAQEGLQLDCNKRATWNPGVWGVYRGSVVLEGSNLIWHIVSICWISWCTTCGLYTNFTRFCHEFPGVQHSNESWNSTREKHANTLKSWRPPQTFEINLMFFSWYLTLSNESNNCRQKMISNFFLCANYKSI